MHRFRVSSTNVSLIVIYFYPSHHIHPSPSAPPPGFVTNTRVTHATPAALYAHSASRNWECDATLGRQGHGCKDIARQLLEDNPGRNIKVMNRQHALKISNIPKA